MWQKEAECMSLFIFCSMACKTGQSTHGDSQFMNFPQFGNRRMTAACKKFLPATGALSDKNVHGIMIADIFFGSC
jgi:hypothetical protein